MIRETHLGPITELETFRCTVCGDPRYHQLTMYMSGDDRNAIVRLHEACPSCRQWAREVVNEVITCPSCGSRNVWKEWSGDNHYWECYDCGVEWGIK